MRRAIPFTNLRVPMAALSLLVIAAGVLGTVLRGGMNLSVDLSGGVAQHIQIAPVALDIGDAGVSLEPELTPPDPLLGRPGFLTVEWLQEGTLRRRVLDFEAYPTIGQIAAELGTIPGVEVELVAAAAHALDAAAAARVPGDGAAPSARLPGHLAAPGGPDRDGARRAGAARDVCAAGDRQPG